MADELGTAVLRLIIDDSAFKDSLNRAKTQIKNELGGAIPTPTAAARPATAPRPGSLTRPAINPITGMTTAYETAQRASAELLQNDLERLQIIRQISQRLQEQADISKGGFGEASRATFGTQDPVEKSIRRNQEKRARDAARAARQEQQAAQQRNALEEDLAQTTARRVAAEQSAANAANAVLANQQKQLANEKKLAAETAKRRKENLKLGKEIAANALIGAGFPLLFGQGIGAAAGGGLGGAAGALGGGTLGFAGSIVGTALGAAFDTALQKAQTLAKGLEDPIGNFGALQEAALLSSRSLEKQVEALIAAGRTGEAYALIQQDLADTFGDPAGAQEYLKAVDDLNREWSKATTTLASFVAGPLAEFLQRLRLAAGGTPRTAEERAVRTEQQGGLAKALLAFGPQIAALGGALSLTGAGAPVGLAAMGLGAAITGIGASLAGGVGGGEDAQKILDSIPAAVAGAKKLREERERDLEIIRLSGQATIENLQGDKLRAAEAEKLRLELEKARAKETAPSKERTQEIARIDKELAANQAERLQLQQQNNLATYQELEQRQTIERSTANTLQLLGTQQGQYRDTLRTVQQITASIEEGRRREAALGFQIGEARIAGRDEEAARLVDQQRTASAETRQRLVEGALALTEAGEKLRNDVRDSALSLAKVRGSEQGLNRFLSPGLQQQRAEQTNRLLRPFFEEAVGRLRQLIPNLDLSTVQVQGANTSDLNRNIIDFIQAVNEEFNATQNFANAQQSLLQVNQALADINTQLVGATNALAQKDWVVSVNVVNQAGGATTVNAVNGLS